MLRLLSIAGSDSGGGAGIQADLKTFQAFGVYGMTVITAVTAQNTEGVRGIWALDPDAVAQQIDAVLDDLGVDGVKIGMLHDAAIISRVADALTPLCRAGIPIVLDPVMRAKGGHALLEPSAEKRLIDRLLPLATVVTPNLPEAVRLTGTPITDARAQKAAAQTLAGMSRGWALVKGGHAEGPVITDWLAGFDTLHAFEHARIDTRHTHGTGCTLSSAIAAGLAAGLSVPHAVDQAEAFVAEAIRQAPGLGRGHGPLNHLWAMTPFSGGQRGGSD
jgi:hydroxymethylpyrimidine/phosphomethylpyrimidine kinase